MAIPYLQTILAGFFISLSGSLPLGNLNLTAMQIAVKQTSKKALWFSAGAVLVELGYLVATLTVIGHFAINKKVFIFFRLLSVAVLMVMAVGSFMASARKGHRNIIIDQRIKRWYLGVAMSAVNPMQLAFWSGWIIYLLSHAIITHTLASYSLFALSAAVGTFIALLVFIFAGRRFSAVLQRKEKQVNILVGSLFAVMAIIQLLKLS